jgi:predicted  nucleic acid-binding Zn-ribbon protein
MQDLNRSIQLLQTLIENKSNAIAILRKSLDDSLNDLQNLKKNLFLAEKDASYLLEQINKKYIVLSNVLNPKEYQSVEKEIILLNKKKNDLETTILEMMEISEKNEKTYLFLSTENLKKIDFLSNEIENALTEIKLLQNAFVESAQKRTMLLPTIPEEWFHDYEKVKERMPNAIVTISSNMCNGCFRTMTESELSMIKRKRVIRCPECYRFLVQESEWKNN